MNNKISNIQFCSAYIILAISSILGIGFYCLLKSADINSYISVIISFFINIFILLLFFKLWNYEPDLPIYEKNKKLLGKTLGNLVNMVFLLISLNLVISGIYNITTFINSQIFPETPVFFISVIITFTSLYLTLKKVDTIFRISTLIVVINTTLSLIAIFNLIITFDFSNLFPILEKGFVPVLKGSVYLNFQTIIPIYALLLIPKNNLTSKEKINKQLIISSIFVYLLIFLIVILILGSLGIYLSRYYVYPEYMVLKNIEMFGFLDRIENILTIQWIFGFLFSSSFLFYYCKDFINNNFNIKSKYNLFLIFTCTIVLFLSSYCFNNDIIYSNYIYNYSIYVKLTFIIILFLLNILLLFKKKKKVV